MLNNNYDVIKTLLRTEKSTTMLPFNKYIFAVDRCANKIEIRKAIEDIYKVKVANVNTQIMSGKKKKVRYQEGKTPDWKKATVTLKEGHKIDAGS